MLYGDHEQCEQYGDRQRADQPRTIGGVAWIAFVPTIGFRRTS